MCGIAGLVVPPGDAPDLDVLGRMTDVLAHRGPDDRGIECLGNVGLGHRRLSIIDLSPAGHQPMATADGAQWITYNGEIYNYIELRQELVLDGHDFRSTSDTEVILAAWRRWGPACLERLNGIFAFAIWEPGTGRLFLARDRLGIKPLYYHFDGRRLAFASEIKALLELPGLPRRVDREALGDYLAFRYVLTEQTLFAGIRKLQPGCHLDIDVARLFDAGRLPDPRCWWDPPFVSDDSGDPRDLAVQLADLIQDAVRLQLRSDVPVGCHLSGGLDSSTLTCIASRLYPGTLRTFTGRFSDAGAFDEGPFAKRVVDSVGADATWIDVKVGDLSESIFRAVRALDEPVVGPGMLPQMEVARVCAESVKVVLGGQGGDELFGGYSGYRHGLLKRWIGTLGLGIRGQGGSTLDAMRLFANQTRMERLSVLRHASPFIANSAWRHVRTPGVPRALETTLVRGGLIQPARSRYLASFNAGNADPLQRMFRFDVKNFLVGLLQVEDRTSMAWSLESRVPLLDHRLVEFAARLPVFLKTPGRRAKPLLCEAVRPFVPAEIVDRTDKQGFPTPLAAWLRNPSSTV
jgi:asparagine synthase (glutamine-hydrolysing)